MYTLIGATDKCQIDSDFLYIKGVHPYFSIEHFKDPEDLLQAEWRIHQVIYDPQYNNWKWIFVTEN